jgi:subtilisin family serine protease
VFVLALIAAGAAYAGVVSPDLAHHLATAGREQLLPVHIVLNEQFDSRLLNSLVDGMPRPARRVEVARILQDFSAREQAGLLQFLAGEAAQGRCHNVSSLWIINAVYCEATPATILALAARGDVNYINYDLAWTPELEKAQPNADERDEIAWGVSKVNAPAVWALGYTGDGVICGHIDTGCDYTHPDLADHMWTDANYPNHGWNFENNNNNPMDAQGHGTHTAGSVASDGTSGSQCGVAPDAQIMVCRVRTQVDSVAESQCWAAMQFCVSPPLSPSNGADLYTMSLGWYISWNPHQATWRQTADNVNAAGLSQMVAAGNERGVNSPPNACRCPGNAPPPWWNPQNTGTGALSGIVSVGATTSADVYASFSSPGPTTWASVAPYNDYAYPPGLTRPDIAAPGDNIKSCAIGGGYTTMSGTSMATPHSAGVVCLMLSKNPNLSPAVIDSILEITALDLGPTGKDNDYGAGRIDALAAVNWVSGSGGPMINLRSTTVLDPGPGGNGDGRLDPGETAQLQMTLRNSGGANCNNVAGTLVSGDARLTVTDNAGTWGNIAIGAEATNTADRFGVTASGTIPPGTVIRCTLHVTGDSADYATTITVPLTVGVPPRQPGEIIWGPKTAPGMPSAWGLYGVAYNTDDDLVYAAYFMNSTIYKYSSDTMFTAQGTIPAPEDSCTDLHYNDYDNTFWLVANPSRTIYKITPAGSVVRSFQVNYIEYPCGIAEDPATHWLYISDRRTGTGATRIFVTDTLGNPLDTLPPPYTATYGSRCLSFDYGNLTNPPSLLNMFTWFDASGTYLDSCVMYETDRGTGAVLNSFMFTNTAWNMRGIEYDPRDGSYWVTIMQGGTTDNMIVKVVGFNYGTGVEEQPGAPARRGQLAVRAYPNPFAVGTALSVQLGRPGTVDLKLYDNNGRLVRTLARGATVAGNAAFNWDGRNERGDRVAPGIYFYQAKATGAEAWGKVVLSR